MANPDIWNLSVVYKSEKKPLLLVSPLNEWTFSVLEDSFESQSGGGFTINAEQN